MKEKTSTFLRWEKLMIDSFGSNGKIAVLYAIAALRNQKQENLVKLPTLLFVGGCGVGKTALADSIGSVLDSEYLSLVTNSYAVIKLTMEGYPEKAIILEEYSDENCDDRIFNLIKQNAFLDRQYNNQPMIITSMYLPLKDDECLTKHCLTLNFSSSMFSNLQLEAFSELRKLEKVHAKAIRNEIISYYK